MTGGKALVLGGTGMLARVAEDLTRAGWLVVLPSRHYSPIATEDASDAESVEFGDARRQADASRQRDRRGRAIWVQADWDRPADLADNARKALAGPADLLVAWVHRSYRRRVLEAVEPLLAVSAPVVEVGGQQAARQPDQSLVEHPTQQVMLGAVSDIGSDRALRHAEIVDAVIAGVHRALEGEPGSVHHVGRPRRRVRHRRFRSVGSDSSG